MSLGFAFNVTSPFFFASSCSSFGMSLVSLCFPFHPIRLGGSASFLVPTILSVTQKKNTRRQPISAI